MNQEAGATRIPLIRFLAMINRIKAAAAERVTAKHPAHSQQQATPRAMAPDGIHGILGACRSESTTGGKQWRKGQLIGPDQEKADICSDFFKKCIHSVIISRQPENLSSKIRRMSVGRGS